MASRREDGLGARLYAVSMRALPAGFRGRNGSAMRQAFADLLAEMRTREGWRGAARCTVLECLDVIRSGFGMRARDLITGLALDLRVAVRSFRLRPGFTAVVLVTLALGIGANTAIFSILSGVLLKPLPYAKPDRIVRLLTTYADGDEPGPNMSYPDFHDIRATVSAFETVSAYRPWGATLVGDGAPERLNGMQVSKGFFDLLDVDAALGRTFVPEEDNDGQDRVIVLSYGLWRSRFGADSAVIGSTLRLNGQPHTVVGVAPRRFAGGLPAIGEADLWRPLGWGGVPEAALPYRGTESYMAIARLRDGVTFMAARAEVTAVMAGIEATHPDTNLGQGMVLRPLQATAVGNTGDVLWVLLGVVGLVLAIAVANVANLFAGRAIDRRAEMALRAALGAGRSRLVRQLLIEGMVLSVCGALIGLLLAPLLVGEFVALSGGTIPLASEITVDAGVLAFTGVVAVAVGLVTGMVPAFFMDARGLRDALLAGASRATAGIRQLRLRGLMVTSQVALSVILLIGAGLLVRSLTSLASVDPGFRIGLLTLRLNPDASRYDSEQALSGFYRDIGLQLAAVPGVTGVGFTSGLPLSGSTCGTLFSEEQPERFAGIDLCAEVRAVSANYFDIMGIPIVMGRGLTDADRADAEGVVVVSRTTAETLWPGQDPLGHRLATGLGGDDLNGYRLFRVVGVAADVKQHGLDEAPPPQTYLTVQQWPRPARNALIDGAGDLSALVPALRSAVREVDDQLPVTNVGMLGDLVGQNLAAARFRTALISAFAILAMLLTVVGLYGVAAYSVTRRRKEIALRLALGAAQRRVIGIVLGAGLRAIMPGIAFGLIGALFASRLLDSLLFGVSSRDPMSYALVPLGALLVALLANYIPARRALRVDPASALRAD